jgi:hypothetical protein
VTESNEDLVSKLISEVDAASIVRAAYFAAHSCTRQQIADILMLTYDHIVAIETTQAYKKKYAEEADSIINAEFERSAGWDELEGDAIAGLMEIMKYQKNPDFLLRVAAVANKAERRSKQSKTDAKVVDASAAGVTNNIVILNMNRGFVERQQNNTIDVTPRPKEIPLKQSDIPPPKLVDEILAPARDRAGITQIKKETDIQRLFRESGVVFDGDDET